MSINISAGRMSWEVSGEQMPALLQWLREVGGTERDPKTGELSRKSWSLIAADSLEAQIKSEKTDLMIEADLRSPVIDAIERHIGDVDVGLAELRYGLLLDRASAAALVGP